MFCPSCGAEVSQGDAFCRLCGRSLSAPNSTPAEPSLGSKTAGTAEEREEPPGRSGEATASLILGLFSFVPIIGLLAVIFGHLAKGSIRRSGGRLLGEGMASLGLVLGYLGLGGWAVYGLTFLVHPFLPSTQRADNEESAIGSLRTIDTAAITYSSMYNRGYPPSLAALGPPKVGNSKPAKSPIAVQSATWKVRGVGNGSATISWHIVLQNGTTNRMRTKGGLRFLNSKGGEIALGTFRREIGPRQRKVVSGELAMPVGVAKSIARLRATAETGEVDKSEVPKAAGLIDEVLAAGEKSGYRFMYTPGKRDVHGEINTYTVHADPVTPGVTGNQYYFTDESDVIRCTAGKEAGADSLPIGDAAYLGCASVGN